MAFTSPARLAFPLKHRESLPIALVKRVPFLVNSDLVMFGFFIAASAFRYLSHPEEYRVFFWAVQVTSFLGYPTSFVLVRRKRYNAASYMSVIPTILNVCWVSFLLPVGGILDFYRFGMYTAVAIVANSLVALSLTQVYAFAVATILAYLGYAFGMMAPAFGFGDPEFRSLALTLFAVVVLSNVFVIFIARIADDLISVAAQDAAKSEEKAARLGDLISGSRGSLRIGELLGAKADESIRNTKELRAGMAALEERARTLSADAGAAGEANASVAAFTKTIRDAVIGQNEVIHETSAALVEIAATISNLARVAVARKTDIDSLLAALGSQAQEMRKVVEGMDRIRESSERVLGSAGLILDVSEKTGLLAMNASIEAAHAGATGKGFAVISQEIRKLSEETRRSTEAISQALRENDSVIHGATTLVHSFQKTFEASAESMRGTFDAMDEIIRGLTEMEKANGELRSATQVMTDIANRTEESVTEVAERAEAGAEGVHRITRFSGELLAQVAEMGERFASIEAAMAAIGEIGTRNVDQISELGRALHEITRS